MKFSVRFEKFHIEKFMKGVPNFSIFEQKYSQSCGRLEDDNISFTEGLSFFCEKYEKFVELVYSPCKKKNKQFVAKRLKRVKNRCFRMTKIR